MHVIRDPEALQAFSREERQNGKRIGLVPTMGCLHEGHLSLVRAARDQTDCVIVTVFVNPTQFGPGEDLDTYPRTWDADLAACEHEGVDVVFAPSPEAMYAPDASVQIEERALSEGLCGETRPGHFSGVLTVVAKLFNLSLPDLAFFGQKDAQQAALIARMVRDLDFPVEIQICPIVRENDGLAMSSRNRYLSPLEREQALGLYAGLCGAETAYQGGERDVGALLQLVRSEIQRAAPDAVIDYVAGVDQETLQPVDMVNGSVLLAVAARIGETRLIDNCVLPKPVDG